MKSILIFGAGKSATYLIEYLCKTCVEKNWGLTVCDANAAIARAKIAGYTNAKAVSMDVSNNSERKSLVEESTLVISMLPPHLHLLVAKDCLEFSKHLLTASYIDKNIEALRNEINDKHLLFLCEMGLDPGIDHMSAMKIINNIRAAGGKVTSFKSHCGGLVAPEDDDNPWHYKITWNPGNIVRAGSEGAIYKSSGETIVVPYHKVFEDCEDVEIPGLSPLAWYPNRDSLSYIAAYGLDGIKTFIRTTLRYPSFCRGWNKVVDINLTASNDFAQIKGAKTYAEWFNIKQQKAARVENAEAVEIDDTEFSEQANYLGLRDERPIDITFTSSVSILQHLLETRLSIKPNEKDMIVMLHEINYVVGGEDKSLRSSLVVKGIDQVHTAMAKTVGLPLGIAAKLILEEKINLSGLHIPTDPEIYEPVLAELKKYSISFNEELRGSENKEAG